MPNGVETDTLDIARRFLSTDRLLTGEEPEEEEFDPAKIAKQFLGPDTPPVASDFQPVEIPKQSETTEAEFLEAAATPEGFPPDQLERLYLEKLDQVRKAHRTLTQKEIEEDIRAKVNARIEQDPEFMTKAAGFGLPPDPEAITRMIAGGLPGIALGRKLGIAQPEQRPSVFDLALKKSITGDVAKIALRMAGGEPVDLSDFEPNRIEEVGSTLMSFLMPLDYLLFLAGGGIGSGATQPFFRRAVTRLVASGIPEQQAKVIATRGLLGIAGRSAAMGGGLGAYSGAQAITKQWEETGNFLDIDWPLVGSEAAQGGLLGIVTGGLGRVGAEVGLRHGIQFFGRAIGPQTGRSLAKLESYTFRTAAEIGSFTVLAPTLEGRVPTEDDFLHATGVIFGMQAIRGISARSVKQTANRVQAKFNDGLSFEDATQFVSNEIRMRLLEVVQASAKARGTQTAPFPGETYYLPVKASNQVELGFDLLVKGKEAPITVLPKGEEAIELAGKVLSAEEVKTIELERAKTERVEGKALTGRRKVWTTINQEAAWKLHDGRIGNKEYYQTEHGDIYRKRVLFGKPLYEKVPQDEFRKSLDRSKRGLKAYQSRMREVVFINEKYIDNMPALKQIMGVNLGNDYDNPGWVIGKNPISARPVFKGGTGTGSKGKASYDEVYQVPEEGILGGDFFNESGYLDFDKLYQKAQEEVANRKELNRDPEQIRIEEEVRSMEQMVSELERENEDLKAGKKRAETKAKILEFFAPEEGRKAAEEELRKLRPEEIEEKAPEKPLEEREGIQVAPGEEKPPTGRIAEPTAIVEPTPRPAEAPIRPGEVEKGLPLFDREARKAYEKKELNVELPDDLGERKLSPTDRRALENLEENLANHMERLKPANRAKLTGGQLKSLVESRNRIVEVMKSIKGNEGKPSKNSTTLGLDILPGLRLFFENIAKRKGQKPGETPDLSELTPHEVNVLYEYVTGRRTGDRVAVEEAIDLARKSGYIGSPLTSLDGWKGVALEVWRVFDPLAGLKGQKEYLRSRYKYQGDIFRVTQSVDNLVSQLYQFSHGDRVAAFLAIDGKLAIENLPEAKVQIKKWDPVQNKKVTKEVTLRHLVRTARLHFDTAGARLVKEGLLSEEAYENLKGQYIKRVYLRYLMDQGPQIGGAYRMSLDYRKARKELTPRQEAEKGKILTPEIGIQVGLFQEWGDIYKTEFFSKIMDNPDFVFQPSMIKLEDGRLMGIGNATFELDMLRKILPHVEPDQRGPVTARIKAFERDIQAAEAAAGKAPWNFVRLPNAAQYGSIAGAYVNKVIADDIQGFFPYGKRGEVERLMQRATAIWKVSKVAFNPPTIARNSVSNVVQLNLSGMNYVEIVGTMLEALNKIRVNDPDFVLARRHGGVSGTFHEAEIASMLKHSKILEDPSLSAAEKTYAFISKVSRFYGKIDEFYKFVKYLDNVKKGMTPQDAVVDAQFWVMDYSLVSRTTAEIRSQWWGAPFVTYQTKILPVMLRAAKERPWVYAKYAAIPAVATQVALNKHGVSEDEWEQMKRSMSEFVTNGAFVLSLGTDAQDRLHVQPVGFYLPFGNYWEAGANVANGEFGEAFKQFGMLGNPILLTLTGLNTGIIPLPEGGRIEIYSAGDTEKDKAAKTFRFLWDLYMPSWLSTWGAGEKTLKAVGVAKPDDILEVELTPAQAAKRWIGLLDYPIDPRGQVKQLKIYNAKVMQLQKWYNREQRRLTVKRAKEDRFNTLQEKYHRKLLELMDQYATKIDPETAKEAGAVRQRKSLQEATRKELIKPLFETLVSPEQ